MDNATDTSDYVYLSYSQPWNSKDIQGHEFYLCSTSPCSTMSFPLEDCDNIQCKYFEDTRGVNQEITQRFAFTKVGQGCSSYLSSRCSGAAPDACPTIAGVAGVNVGFPRNNFYDPPNLDERFPKIICQYPSKGLIKNVDDLGDFYNKFYIMEKQEGDDMGSMTVNGIIADYCILGSSSGPCIDNTATSCPPIFSTEDSARNCQQWYKNLQTINNPDLNNIYNTRTQMYCNKEENINKLECSCINATNDTNPNKYHELYNNIAKGPNDLDRTYCWLSVCDPSSTSEDGIFIPPSYKNDSTNPTCKYEKCDNVIINQGTIQDSTIDQLQCLNGDTSMNPEPSNAIKYNRFVCETVDGLEPCQTKMSIGRGDPKFNNSYSSYDECHDNCTKPPPSSPSSPPSQSPSPPSQSPTPPSQSPRSPTSPSPPSSPPSILQIIIIIVLIIVIFLMSIGIFVLISRRTQDKNVGGNIIYV